MTADLWLAQHAITCAPMEARISPAACATQQGRGRLGCPCANRVTGVAPLPAKRKRHPRGLAHWILTGRKLTAAELGYDPEDDDISEAAKAPASAPKTPRRRGRIAKKGTNPYSTHFAGRQAAKEAP